MTQTNAGNLIRTALLCLLLLLCAGGALAESDGNLDVFDDAFMKEHGLVDAKSARACTFRTWTGTATPATPT